MVLLPIDEQSEHHQLEEVVEPTGISSGEADLPGLFEFPPHDFGRSLDNCVFLLFGSGASLVQLT